MLKFEVDAEKQLLHFEFDGEDAELAVDALVCLRKLYDVFKDESEEAADNLIGFFVEQLANPRSAFYEDVDWPDEGWEDTQC